MAQRARKKNRGPANECFVCRPHGLICLIGSNRDTFIADPVDMGSDHEYFCGDFLFAT